MQNTFSVSQIVELVSSNVNIDTPDSFATQIIQWVVQAINPKLYGGFYYGTLVDTAWWVGVTIKIPRNIMHNLSVGKLITVKALCCLKAQTNERWSDIKIHLLISSLLDVDDSIDQTAKQKILLMSQKVEQGKKDVYSLVRNNTLHEKKTTLSVIYGASWSVTTDEDFRIGLGANEHTYAIHWIATNLSSIDAMVDALKSVDTDMLVLIRWWWTWLEIFNDLTLGKALLACDCITVVWLWHSKDAHFLDKLADVSMITPTAVGQYLSNIVDTIAEENQQSKQLYLTSLKKEFEQKYAKDIAQYTTTIASKEKQLKEYREQQKKETASWNEKKLQLEKDIVLIQQHILSLETKNKQILWEKERLRIYLVVLLLVALLLLWIIIV